MKIRASLIALLSGVVLSLGTAAYASGIDMDEDGWEDDADNCVTISNPSQSNNDLDDYGDACDSDDDNDDVSDGTDLYPLDSSRWS